MKKGIPTLKETVKAYIACGRKSGFAIAESILSKYMPDHILEGKCYNVHPKERRVFIEDLKSV